jgi:parallel beta helix pectate lyase-like protein
MPYCNSLSPSGPEVLALLQEELERTAALPGFAVAGRALWSRFARYFQGLTRLPRRLRRALQRRWRRSLGGIALLCALGQAPALAATIGVGGGCTLVGAITAANTDTVTGGCSAGSGADILILPSESTQTLTAVNNNTNGPTGLPVITSELTIEGNGSTITRDSALEFRILAVGATGNLTLKDTVVSGGAATEGRGEGGIDNAGILALSDVQVERNTAYFGGGIDNSGSLTFNCCAILSNTAASAAGIRNFYFGTMALTNVDIEGNAARYGSGGAENDGTLTLSASTVSGNTGSTGGISNGGTLTLSDCTVEGNTADGSGGGVKNASSLTLTNSTISGNTAADRGGGVYNRETLTLTNSTVSRNASGRLGGGLFNQRELTLVQTLISGNTALVNGPEAYSVGSQSGGTVVTADGFNVFGHDGSSGVLGFTLGATDLVPGVPLSAILDPTLGYNGGPSGVRSHTLVFGTPAVDAVPWAACATVADQRGAPRPQDGDGDNVADCDIGAIERGLIAVQAAITSTTLARLPDRRVPGPRRLQPDGGPVHQPGRGHRARPPAKQRRHGDEGREADPVRRRGRQHPARRQRDGELEAYQTGQATHASDQEKAPEGRARHPGDHRHRHRHQHAGHDQQHASYAHAQTPVTRPHRRRRR